MVSQPLQSSPMAGKSLQPIHGPPFQEMVFLTRDEISGRRHRGLGEEGVVGGGGMLKQLAAHSLLGCFKKIMLF